MKKILAKMLAEEHPGIDNEDIAMEVVDSFLIVLRKYLIREKELTLEGIGTIEVKKFSGAERKRDARTGIEYKVTPRNVLKFKPSMNLKRVLNLDREPSQPLNDGKNGDM